MVDLNEWLKQFNGFFSGRFPPEMCPLIGTREELQAMRKNVFNRHNQYRRDIMNVNTQDCFIDYTALAGYVEGVMERRRSEAPKHFSLAQEAVLRVPGHILDAHVVRVVAKRPDGRLEVMGKVKGNIVTCRVYSCDLVQINTPKSQP